MDRIVELLRQAFGEVTQATLDDLPKLGERVGELVQAAAYMATLEDGPRKEVQHEVVLAKVQMVYEAIGEMGDDALDPKVLVRVLLLGLKIVV